MKEESVLDLIDSFQLSTETENKPTFFQLIFRIDNTRYRYGFEADDKSIKSEWLFSTPNKREQPLFIRENKLIVNINQTHFEEGEMYQKLFKNSEDPIFTDTSLFLTHLSTTGFGKLSKQIVKTISAISVISGLGHRGMYGIAGASLSDAIKKGLKVYFVPQAVAIHALENSGAADRQAGPIVSGLQQYFDLGGTFPLAPP